MLLSNFEERKCNSFCNSLSAAKLRNSKAVSIHASFSNSCELFAFTSACAAEYKLGLSVCNVFKYTYKFSLSAEDGYQASSIITHPINKKKTLYAPAFS